MSVQPSTFINLIIKTEYMRYFLLQKYGQTCIDIPVLKFFLRLRGECDNNLALCMETPRKFIIARLSIRKLGSSSVLII